PPHRPAPPPRWRRLRGARPGARAAWAFAALLDELGHQPGPARLVVGPDAGAVVAVEVLVEEDEVAPVGIALEAFGRSVDGAPAVAATQEQVGEAPRQLGAHLPQVQQPTGAGRA